MYNRRTIRMQKIHPNSYIIQNPQPQIPWKNNLLTMQQLKQSPTRTKLRNYTYIIILRSKLIKKKLEKLKKLTSRP